MTTLINEILKSQTSKKMIANLISGRDMELRRGLKLTEFSFISELPTKQMELFDLLYSASKSQNRADFAIDLMKGNPIKWVS